MPILDECPHAACDADTIHVHAPDLERAYHARTPNYDTIARIPELNGYILTTPREQDYRDDVSLPTCSQSGTNEDRGCGGKLGSLDAACFTVSGGGWIHPACYVANVLGWGATSAPAAATEATSEDASAADDADDAATCALCDLSEDDCTCRTCEHRRCGDRVVEDEWCATCEMCERHCECWTCDSCNNRYARDSDVYCCSTCNACQGDRGCCDCFYCESCNEYCRPHHACGSCDDMRCESCCNGHSSSDIPFADRSPSFRRARHGQRRHNRSARLIGVEVEVARCEEDAAGDLWEQCERDGVSVVEDGSLPDGGFELNTVPASGDLFVEHIGDLGRELRRASAEVNAACGLHVHIDASDFTFYDMRRLVFLYEKLEPALFAMMPRSRRDSSYCNPCGATYADALRKGRMPKESKAALLDGIYGGTGDDYKGASMRQRRASKWGQARYRALNLHSWVYRGTVECRLHTGTTSDRKIIAWGMLWAAILDYAYKAKEGDIIAMRSGRELRDSIDMLLHVAPTSDVKAYICERIEKYGCAEGKEYVRNIRMAV